MLRYALKRILMMIPILLAVTLIIFTLVYITPGNPAELLLPDDATEEQIAMKEEELGLNDPFFVRYFDYVKGIVTRFDFGTSYTTGRSVTDEILVRFPTTIKLAVASIVVAMVLGVLCGVTSAVHQYTFFDNCAVVVSMLGVSMPNFWQGLLNILIFSVILGWFAASGIGGFKFWVLPALTIGTSSAANIMRMTRSTMLEVIRQDYIRTARGKGQTERVIRYVHALRNAMIPIVTVIGNSFGSMLCGAVLTESIFSIPGLGKLVVDAISVRNYPMVQGTVLFIAFIHAMVNLFVDLLYAAIDPRIRSRYEGAVRKKAPRIAKEAMKNE